MLEVILPVCGSWRSVKVKCLLMSERLSSSCGGFGEPASKKPQNTLPSPVERIRRLFSNLQRFAWRRVGWSVCFVASLQFFFIGYYLRSQNSTKCHFNRPGKTRRRSVKGMLALFCYMLIFGLFQLMGVSATRPMILSMLTHTTSGQPVYTLRLGRM